MSHLPSDYRKSVKPKKLTVRIIDEESDDWMNVKQEKPQVPQVDSAANERAKWKPVGINGDQSPPRKRSESPPRRPRDSSPPRKPNDVGPPKTVFRDARGRVVDIEEETRKHEESKRRKEQEEVERKQRNKGTAQKQAALAEARRLQEMSNAPFSRSADDKDLNRELKDRIRWDDPLAKEKVVETKKRSSKKVCPHSAPPNRFSIPPGYSWDGVDRSNGFERKWFQQQATGRAQTEEAYKWSVEDM